MFDNQQPQPGSPTMSKKAAPPEDIFSGTDEDALPSRPMPPGLDPKEIVSAPPRPISPALTSPLGRGAGTPPMTSAPAPSHAGTAKKFLIIGAIVILVVVAAALLAGLILRSKKAIVPVEEPVETVPSVTTPIENLVPTPTDSSAGRGAGTPPIAPAPEPIVVDSDRDGLTDSEELTLGTSPRSADTDVDGLSDRDEIKQWKTNPLNPDTDGDTYKDGDEVNNGYNPKGAGKLFEVPND